MQITWHIEYYESPVGNKPVEEFKAQKTEKKEIKVALERLREYRSRKKQL